MPAILPRGAWTTWLGETDVLLTEVKALPQTFGDGGNWVMTEQTPRSPRPPQPRGQIPSRTFSSTRGVDFERMFVPDGGCIRRCVA